MQRDDKVFSMLGLAKRAGKIESGQFKSERCIKSGQAALVILSGDASENTEKQFRDMCAWRKIPCIAMADRDQLGSCIGQEQRCVLAVTDASFAGRILELAGYEPGEATSEI